MATKKPSASNKATPHKKTTASSGTGSSKSSKQVKKVEKGGDSSKKDKLVAVKKKVVSKIEKTEKAEKKSPSSKKVTPAKTKVASPSSIAKKEKTPPVKKKAPVFAKAEKEKKIEKTERAEKVEKVEKIESKASKKINSKKEKSGSKGKDLDLSTEAEVQVLASEDSLSESLEEISQEEQVIPSPSKGKASKKSAKSSKAEKVSLSDAEEDLGDQDDDLADEEIDDLGDENPEDYFENLEKQQSSRSEDDEDDEDFEKSFAKTSSDGELSLSDLKRREMESLERGADPAFGEDLARVNMDYNMDEIRASMQGIDFYAIADTDECLERSCENIQTTQGYCRYHYIKNWKAIKRKATLLKEGKLQSLIEELVSHYPLKYIEAIMKDLSGDKEFFQVLKDLNIESTFSDDDLADIDLDDDITVETRGYGGVRVKYEEEEI